MLADAADGRKPRYELESVGEQLRSLVMQEQLCFGQAVKPSARRT